MPAKRQRAHTTVAAGLAAALAAILAPTTAMAFSLVNPSMESADPKDTTKPAAWTGSAWGDVKATFSWQDGGADGNKSLRVEVTATGAQGDAKWSSAATAVKTGTRLMIRHKYRSTVATTVLVRFAGAGNQQSFAQIDAPAISLAKWSESFGSVLVPDWASTAELMHVIKAVGTLETDAFDVTAITLVPEPKLPLPALANPSAETANPNNPVEPYAWKGSAWGQVKAALTWQDDAFEGKKSLRIDVSATGKQGDAKWASLPFVATDGMRLLISNKYRSTTETKLLVLFAGGGKEQYEQLFIAPASPGKWSEASGNVLVPKWATSAQLMQAIKDVGSLEVDAWQVTVITQGAPPKLPLVALANGSAEQADPDNPAQPWAWIGSSWGDGAATLSWLDGGDDGKKLLRAQITKVGKEGDAKWTSLPFAVKAGARLKVVNRYRCDVKTRVLAKFEGVAEGKAKTEHYAVADAQPTGGQWATMTGIVTVPSWATQVSVAHVIAVVGTLDVDAWQAVEAKDDEFVLPPAGKTPLVSITFDDGWTSAYHLLISEMDKRGLRGTHFIVADFIDKVGFQADYIGKDKIISLLKNKHELGSHSWQHKDLKTLTQAALDKDLGDSRKRLQELFGVNIAGMAPPYGSYDESTLPMLKKHYKYSRTVKGGLNEKPYKLHELYTIVVHKQMDMDEFAGWVTQAAVEGKWLILLYHRAAKDPPSDSYVKPSEFIRQMDYLVKVGADVKPVGEVLGVWLPAPVEELTPDIVTGKSLTPAPAVSKNSKYLQPVDPNTGGCAASRRPDLPGKSAFWLIVLAALSAGVWRRRVHVVRSGK